jgi:hypothetical protein
MEYAMKETELRECAECAKCHKKIGETGLPLFWRVTIERFGVDLNAVRRQDGLTAMLSGHAGLAAVMGPDEDIAVRLMDPVKATICESCAMSPVLLPLLAGMD